MDVTTLDDFYRETSALIPPDINKEIGHFNVFKIDEVHANVKKRNVMPYNRRAYYKISCISGRNKAEYADKVIDIEKTHCCLPRRKYLTIGFLRMTTSLDTSAFLRTIF